MKFLIVIVVSVVFVTIIVHTDAKKNLRILTRSKSPYRISNNSKHEINVKRKIIHDVNARVKKQIDEKPSNESPETLTENKIVLTTAKTKNVTKPNDLNTRYFIMIKPKELAHVPKSRNECMEGFTRTAQGQCAFIFRDDD